jgi:type IV secretion system protein VirD4
MKDDKNDIEDALPGLIWMTGGVAIASVVAWCIPAAAALVNARRLPHLGPLRALVAGLRLLGDGRWRDPATAYPRDVQPLLPGPLLWWTVTLVVLGAAGALGLAALRRFEPQVAHERLGRRSFDWRGARPREWARHRDLRQPRSAPVGFSLGRLDGRPVHADEESHVVVVAPTRAGKTTRCVIPWLLEHDGPAIVTSTNRDVIDAASEAGERVGRIWIFDPFGTESMAWSPLAGCESWSGALRQAQWLADASSDGDSEIARYWRGEAAKLLAPLLHAAALGGREMPTVLGWVDAQETRAVLTILSAAQANPARAQLKAISELDPRNRGTTYMSAGSVLAAYRYPEVQQLAGDDFSPSRFVASAADTLFLVAEDRHQQLVAPLLVALLAAVLHEAIETGTFHRGERRLKLLLDEAANVAPLSELPRTMSQVAGHGIRVATVWQSLAQMRERYGRGSETIIANSTAKLYLGPITDDATRDHVVALLGDPKNARGARSRVGAAALQQLVGDRALLVAGARLPALVTLRPYWK